MKTSARAASLRTSSAPSGRFSATATPRLPRLSIWKLASSGGAPGPTAGCRVASRIASPRSASTLMTSAPRSAIIAAAPGAAIQLATSTTRMPESGATTTPLLTCCGLLAGQWTTAPRQARQQVAAAAGSCG